MLNKIINRKTLSSKQYVLIALCVEIRGQTQELFSYYFKNIIYDVLILFPVKKKSSNNNYENTKLCSS